jgi:hypothetical protein
MTLRTWLGVAAFLLCGSFAARADMISDLSKEEIAKLMAGEMIVSGKDMPTGGWPQVTVYTFVKAPVDVIEGVLRDYEHAQDFQPGLVSAKVISHPSPDVYEVEYTSKLPMFGTTTYTMRNTFKNVDNGFEVTWKLVKSSMAEISDGSLRAEPYKDGSIFRYVNYVKPKSSIAMIAKNAALGEAKKTVSELKAEAEKRAKD